MFNTWEGVYPDMVNAEATNGSSICRTSSILCAVLENNGGIPLDSREIGRSWNLKSTDIIAPTLTTENILSGNR